jgi:hypothetical protein
MQITLNFLKKNLRYKTILFLSLVLCFFIIIFNQKKIYTYKIRMDNFQEYEQIINGLIYDSFIEIKKLSLNENYRNLMNDRTQFDANYNLFMKDRKSIPTISKNFPQHFLNINNKNIYVFPIKENYYQNEDVYFNIVTTENLTVDDINKYLDLYYNKLYNHYQNYSEQFIFDIKKFIIYKPSNLEIKSQKKIKLYYELIDKLKLEGFLMTETPNLNFFCNEFKIEFQNCYPKNQYDFFVFYELIVNNLLNASNKKIDQNNKLYYLNKESLIQFNQINSKNIENNFENSFDEEINLITLRLNNFIKNSYKLKSYEVKFLKKQKSIKYMIIDFIKYLMTSFFLLALFNIFIIYYKNIYLKKNNSI